MDKILRVCKSEQLPPLYDREPNYIYFVYDKMRLHFYQSFYTDPFCIVESMPPKEEAVENMLYLVLDGTMKTYIDYSIIEVGTIEDPAQIDLLMKAGTIYFMNAESRYLDWQKRTLELPFQNGSYQLTLNLMKQLKIDRETIIRFNEDTNQFYIAGKEYQPDTRLDNIGKLGASYTDSVRTTIDQYRNWVKSDIRLAPDEDNDLSVKWNGLYINVSDHATQADFDQLISAYESYRVIINSYIYELKDALQQVTGAVSNDTIGEKVLATLETYKATIDEMFDKYEDLADRTRALELESTSGVDMRIEQIKQEIIAYINSLQHPWERLTPDLNPPLEYTSGETDAQFLLIEEFRRNIIELRLLSDMNIVILMSEAQLPDMEVDATYHFVFDSSSNLFQEYIWEDDAYVPLGDPVTYKVILAGDGDNTETGGVEGTDPTPDTNGGGEGGGDGTDTPTDPQPELVVDTYNLLPDTAEDGSIYTVLSDWTNEETGTLHPAGMYIFVSGMWLEHIPPMITVVVTYDLLPTDVGDGTIYTVLEDWTDEETGSLYPAGMYIFTGGEWVIYEGGDDGGDSGDDIGNDDPIDNPPSIIGNRLSETEKAVQDEVFTEFDNVRLIMKYYEEYSSFTQLPLFDGSEFKTYYVIQKGNHFVIDNNDGTYSQLVLNSDGTVTIEDPVTDPTELIKDTVYHVYQYENGGYVLVYNANNNNERLPDPDPGTDPMIPTVDTYNLLPADAMEGDVYYVANDWTDPETNVVYDGGRYIFIGGMWTREIITGQPPVFAGVVDTYDQLLELDAVEGSMYEVLQDDVNPDNGEIIHPAGIYLYINGQWEILDTSQNEGSGDTEP